jgi:NAD+ synthase (glutamine-hydrolysing)
MRIAAAQLNQTVGDFRGNADRIIVAAGEAAASGARILLTPELSLTGYPPEDLLLRDAFQRASDAALKQLAEATAHLDIHLLVGHPVIEDRGDSRVRYNAASWVHKGRVLGLARKRELPNYAVFDEQRYFEPYPEAFVFEVDGLCLGVAICEDVWFPGVAADARAAGARALLVLNASPFHLGKQHLRLDTFREHVSALGMPMVSANLVGGQDELVFDGLSFALSARGELAAQAKAFEPDLLLVDLLADSDAPVGIASGPVEPVPPIEEQVYRALVLGVRDYVDKNGFPGAIIGLSGGVDSALVLAVAVDALGADRVRAVMMPSAYTADISWLDAREMARRLGVRYDELPIGTCFDAFRSTLAGEFAGLSEDATEENLQARIRGTLLMALSNKFGSIVLTTGNKSEMAVGYCTLYGDMAGGFAVIKDISKTLVWRLCRWRNQRAEVIPERIITRAPSAELRPGQTDQDSLPPYDVLDEIMRLYMEEDRSVPDIVDSGIAADAVERVVRLIRINEYKRRQAPVGIRVTHRAFGRDWRYPITSKFRG